MNKKLVLSVLSTAVVASMATSAFAAAPKAGVYLGGNIKKFYALDTLFNLNATAKTEFSNYIASLTSDFNQVVYVDASGKGASIQEILTEGYNTALNEALVAADFADQYSEVNASGQVVGTVDPEADLGGTPAGELKVESVSAINSAQLEIKFGKAVDETTVVDNDGTLKAGVLTVSKVSGSGSITVDGTSLATLSADGKTLTVTAAAGAFSNLKYVVTTPANTIADEDGKFFEAYTSNVLDAADAVAPTITTVTTLNASTVRVNFSEPLSAAGNWTFKFADGTTAVVVPSFANIAKGYVDLAIDPGVQAGKQITATIIGATDYAGNLISPNPVTVNFTKGVLDGTKPTVQSVTTLGLNKFEIKFSEEVQGFTETDVTVDGVARTANDATPALAGTEAIVTQDATDKTKYTVEFVAVTPGVHTVGLAANAVTDLSGETSDAFSKVVEFKADTTAPQLVSSQVKKDDNGDEYLHLVFNEAVNIVDIDTLTATSVKDYVTTQGTVDLTGLTAVDATNKEYKVKLADVEFDPAGAATAAAVTAGATYTVTLTGALEDTSGVDLGTTTITFTRGTDSATVAQSVDSVAKVVGNPSEVKVTFDQDVDGATATNAANYRIDGVVVEKAEIRAGEPNVVYLTLQSGSNTLDGARNITINGVKTKAGVAMTTAYSGTVILDENVKPTFTAALVASDSIKLTFSEGVTDATDGITVADLKVKYDATDLTETGGTPQVVGVYSDAAMTTAITNADTVSAVYIKLASGVIADLSKSLEVVTESSSVKDVKGNVWTTGTVTVSK